MNHVLLSVLCCIVVNSTPRISALLSSIDSTHYDVLNSGMWDGMQNIIPYRNTHLQVLSFVVNLLQED